MNKKFFIILFIITIPLILIGSLNKETNGYIARSIPFDLIETKKSLKKELRTRSENLADFSSEPVFYFSGEENILNSLKGKKINYNLIKFTNPVFPLLGPRSYLAHKDKNLFLMNGVGDIYYGDIDQINKKKIQFTKLKSNIRNLIDADFGLGSTMAITRHLLIHDEHVYVSFVKKRSYQCYVNSVVVAKINLEKIEFKNFFEIDECSPFNSVGSGGTLSSYKENKILMSVGDYEGGEFTLQDHKLIKRKVLSQDKDSLLGKIISINIQNKDVKILSMGHRNVMGIYYDNKKNLIYLTENGPKGGDEINIIKESENTEIPNFGWPISSYGEHYGYAHMKFIDQYKRAPLNKSHSKYGFVEPIIYFVPSVAPTQITKVENLNNDNIHLYFGALAYRRPGHSLHKLELNNDFEIIDHYIIPLDERVRDLIYLEKEKKLLLFLETSGTIAVLSNN